MKKQDWALALSALGLIGLSKSNPKEGSSSRRLKTAGARTAWTKESQTYSQSNLLLLAVREAVQNSLDAVRAAIDIGQVTEEDAFISVYLDQKERRLIIQDTGVGMNETRLDKFLTLLGSEKAEGASGGWGVAKAVIFKISKSFKAIVRTHNVYVPVQGFADEQNTGFSQQEQVISGLPFYKGTTIIIEDVEPKFLDDSFTRGWKPSNTFGGSNPADITQPQLIRTLMSFVGTNIPLYSFGYHPDEFTRSHTQVNSNFETFLSDNFTKAALVQATAPITPPEIYKVIRTLNIGDGGEYTGDPLIKIDPSNGRKTRKKGMFDFINKDGKYLKGNMYLGNKADLGVRFFGRGSMQICIRLNGMFMFWKAEFVSSEKLKTKAIVVDFETNIKPYEEAQYPVTKTREKLQTEAGNIIRELTGVMDRESVSAGANFDAQVVLTENQDGLNLSVNKSIQDFIERTNNPALRKALEETKKITPNEDQSETINQVIQSNGYRARQFREQTDVVYSNSDLLRGNEDSLGNFIPSIHENESVYLLREYYTEVLAKARRMLEELFQEVRSIDRNRDVDPQLSSFSNYLSLIIEKLPYNEYVRVDLDQMWALFVRRHQDFKSYLTGYNTSEVSSSSDLLLPPFHLIFMDIRDVLVCVLNPKNLDSWFQRAVAKLNILIAYFGSPGSFRLFVEYSQYSSFEDPRYAPSVLNTEPSTWYSGYAGFNSEQDVQNVRDFLQFCMNRSRTSANSNQYVGYAFGINRPSIYRPKLLLTKLRFPNPRQYWKQSKKQLEIIDTINFTSHGMLGGGYDHVGCPLRIRNDIENWAPDMSVFAKDPLFALVERYDKTQCIVVVQGLFTPGETSDGSKANLCLPHMLYGTASEVIDIEFLMYLLEEEKTISTAALSIALQDKNRPQMKGYGDILKKVIASIKKFHKSLPSKLLSRSMISNTITINPFDGFAPVRYDISMTNRDKLSIERRFLDYLPLLSCWATIVGIVDTLSTSIWTLSAKPKAAVSPGLAFGSTSYLALMQSTGNDYDGNITSAFLWLNADLFLKNRLPPTERAPQVEYVGTQMYSVVIHEYAHVIAGGDGHGQEYAGIRDTLLKRTLPFLPVFLEIIAEILGLKPPKTTMEVLEIKAKLAIKQQQIKSLKAQNRQLKKRKK